MKTICTNFANKIGVKIYHLYFLYNGKKIDLNKSLKQTKSFSFFDITILANKLEEIEKLFICPYCGENIDSYDALFYDLLLINDSIVDKLDELKRKCEEIIGTDSNQAYIIANELEAIGKKVEKRKDEIRNQLREIYINNSKSSIISIKVNMQKSNFLLYNSFEEIEVLSNFKIIKPIKCQEKRKYFNSKYDTFKLDFKNKSINLSEFFRDCSPLTYVDLSNFDSSSVTDMSYMFYGCSSLKEINLTNKFNTNKVINMNYMFYKCENLIFLDLSNFDSSNVTDMSYMFSGCKSLKIILLKSKFNTRQVTNMESMFDGCINLISLDLSNFDTSKVTNINKMFYGCTSLNNIIGINELNIKNVINNNEIFSFIKIDWLNIFKYAIIILETEKVINEFLSYNKNYNIYFLKDNVYYPFLPTNIQNNKTKNQNNGNTINQFLFISIDGKINLKDFLALFEDDSSLTYINLSNFDSSDITDMSNMFSNCSSLEEINLTNKFNTNKVINMESMFEGCKNLIFLDLSNFDTSNVINMNFMFSGCLSLEEIKLTNKFNTNKVIDMKSMFNNCKNLFSLDLSNFDTSNVTDMSYMFSNCSSLKEIKLVNKFNTNKVINMESMFNNCINLISLDLSNFDTSNVTNMNNMFYGCTSLNNIIGINELNKNINFCFRKLGYNQLNFYKNKIIIEIDEHKENDIILLYNETIKIDIYFIYHNEFYRLLYDNEYKNKNIYKYRIIDSNFGAKKCSNNRYLYSYTNQFLLVCIDDIIDLSECFRSCISIIFLDLSNLDSSDVTDMSYMFSGCSSLKEINLTNKFNTSKVVNMKSMFSGCENLTSLDLSNFDISNVTDMSYMFYGCSSLEEIILSDKLNTIKDINMNYMFFDCSSLVKIIGINELDTNNIIFSDLRYDWLNLYKNRIIIEVNKDIYSGNILLYNKKFNFNVYFENDNAFCPILTNDDQKELSSLQINSNKFQNRNYYYSNNNNEISFDQLKESGFNPNKFLLVYINNLINLNEFFKDCSSLTYVDLSNFDSSDVTDMSYMFSGCESLKEINLTNKFNTNKVINMNYMFYNCKNLISLDLSNFDSSNVTDMSYMFSGCESLKEINLANKFNTNKVINMNYMFYNCKNLISLDLSNFVYHDSIDMSYIFYYCSSLKEIKGLEKFYDIHKFPNMFEGCKNLKMIESSRCCTLY